MKNFIINIIKKNILYFNIILSLILVLYFFFKSEIIYEGTNRDHFLKYYILSFSYLILAILIYKISHNLNKVAIIITLSIFASFYSFEFYLSKNFYLDENLNVKIKKYEKDSNKDWDHRTQYQVYEELLKTKKNVVPYFYPSELVLKNKLKIHSLAGVSNSLTVFCNENGYYSINLSDRYGFNNPDSEWDANEIDYVFVGDSFTHGYCVNRPHDIPSVIRKNYSKTVLNLGYGRNGPLIEYATLREYLPMNVKKIIFMYYEHNDLDNLQKELTNNILFNYIKNENFSQNLMDKQTLIDYEKRKHISARSDGAKFEFLKLRKTRKAIKEITFLQKNKKNSNLSDNYKLEKLERILLLSKKLASERKSDFYFVYLPSPIYYFENKQFPEESLYFNQIRSMVNRLNINFIDIHKEVFEKEKNPTKLFPFELSGHYNIEGYKKVAEAIYTSK